MKLTPVAVLCAIGAALLSTMSVALAAASPTPQASPLPARPTPAASPTPLTLPPPVPTMVPVTPPPSGVATVLSLSQAEDVALASSPELTIQRAIVDQNNASIGIARSNELPNLSVNDNYSRSKQNVTSTRQGGASQPLVFTQNNGFIELKQLILDGGRVNAEVQAARYSTDAAKLTLLRSIQTVLLTVAQQYYAALQARHQLEAALRALDLAKVQYHLVEAQYRAGVASRADVLTAQLPVSQAEVTVATAQNGEAQNVAALLTTMGLAATTPVILKDDTSVSGTQPKLDEIISSAQHQRTDLSAARSSVSSAQASVRAAKLAAFPLIGATASSGTASTSVGGTNFAANWSVGASLSFPLYSGGLIRSQADQARAFEQQAEANLKSTQLNVYLNVQQAYLQLATAAASLNTARVAFQQGVVVLDVTNAQYKAGVTTLPLLLNAQTQLTTVRSNYIQALYAYKIAQQNLLYAEGTIAPM
jgi:outer membrane protein TolC